MALKASIGAVVCAVFLASTVRSLPRRITRGANAEPKSAGEYHPPMDYRFRYQVKDEPTTNFHNRIEISKDGIVKGSYSLLSPDGILRTTVYSDKGEGYKVTLHEEPTDIRVIGSGLPGDPLGSYGEGSSYDHREKSSQAFQRLGGFPFDFEGLSELSSLEEKGPSIYRKSKQKTKSQYQIRDSEEEEEESSIFIASSSPYSSDLTSSLKESSHSSSSSHFASDGPSSKDEQKIATIPIDQETFGSLGQEQLVAAIQEMIKDKTEREQKFKEEETEDEERSDESDRDDRPGLKETESEDDLSESKLDIPIIAIDQGLFDSLSLPESTFRQNDLVRAIQQAAQKAQSHTQSSATVSQFSGSLDVNKKTESSSGRFVGLTDSRRSQQAEGYGDDNFDKKRDEKENDGIIPVITIDQSILDSLSLPASTLKEKELVLAIQQAAKAALRPVQSDAVSHFESSKDEITHEFNVENKGEKYVGEDEESNQGEGDTPVIALEQSEFDSLSLPGSTFSQRDLALAIQKATQAALNFKSSASGISNEGGRKESSGNLGSSFSSSRVNEENEIANEEGNHFDNAPGSTSVFIKFSGDKDIEGERKEYKKSNTESEREVPVIAIEREVFDSLSLPGSNYRESDLITAIQQATKAALKPLQSHSDSSHSTGIDKTKGKIDGKDTIVVSNDQGANGEKIPVIAIDQSAFGSLFLPKSTIKHDILAAIQQATRTALSQGDLSSSSGSSVNGDGETTSQVTQSKKGSSSSTLGLISADDNSISGGNIPIVVLEKTLFDALPARGKTELLSAFQQATQVASASGAEATRGVGEKTKIKVEKEKASSSSFSSSSSSSSSFDSSTSLDSGSVVTHSEGTATSDGIIPVIALEQTLFKSMNAKEKSKLISSIQEAANTIFNQRSSPSTIERDSKGDSSKLNFNVGFSSGSSSTERGIPVLALNKKLFDSMSTQEKNKLLSEIQQATQSTIGTSNLSSASESHLGGESISSSFISSSFDGSKSGLGSSSSALSLTENLASGNGIPIIALEQAMFDSMSLQEKNGLLATIKKATELALSHPKSSSKPTSNVKEISSGGSTSAAINFEKKTISGSGIPVVAVDEILFNSMSAQEKGNLITAIQQATVTAVTGSTSPITTGSATFSSTTGPVQSDTLLDINDPSQNFVNPSEVTPAEVNPSSTVTHASDHIDFGQGVFEAVEQLNEAAQITGSSNSQTNVDEGLLESFSTQLRPITQSNTQSAGPANILEQNQPIKSKQIFEDLGSGLRTVDLPLSRTNNINSNTLLSFTNSVSEFEEMHNKMVDPVSRA